MTAALVITQPGGPALALVAALAAAAVARRLRRGRGRAAAGLAGLAAVAAPLLVHFGGPRTALLLAAAALAAGLWLVLELGRRYRAALARPRRAALAGLRLGAWTIVLLLLARPACDRRVISRVEPVLAVLLDHSASMALADPAPPGATPATRAARVAAALAQAAETRARLDRLYDVRLLAVGARPAPLAGWDVRTGEPLTALADALREARGLRGARGRPPAAVLVVSDGAENVADAAAVRQAAAELARQGTPLLAAGVGPPPEQTVLVELEPLAVPARLGLRETLRVPVAARVLGCAGRTAQLDLLWNEELAASVRLPVEGPAGRIETTFLAFPPGAGARRLTARLTVPDVLGDQIFATSAIIDVASEHVRVLYVDTTPRAESAFALRALRGDPALDVTPLYLFDGDALAADPAAATALWAGYDVIVLGRLRASPAEAALAALADAVTQRGAGLLLAGGGDLLAPGLLAGTPLEDLCPVYLRAAGPGLAGQVAPTAAGLRHPILAGLPAAGPATAAATAPAGPPETWQALPPLSIATTGDPKPAAQVIARDERQRPVLVAQEVGRGRVLAAAWESTWPWALAPPELRGTAGEGLHARLWRQMVVWLANRRPRAWVVTDEPRYAWAAVAGGQRRVQVRAGVSGLEPAAGGAVASDWRPVLTLQRIAAGPEPGSSWSVALRPEAGEWRAELPGSAGSGPGEAGQPGALAAGTYALELEMPGPDGESLRAGTRFDVVEENSELRPPTANLALLRAAAERTAECGGRYVDVAELPGLLAELAGRDLRERVETVTRHELLRREPWGLLAWLVVLLGAEWALRKASGLP